MYIFTLIMLAAGSGIAGWLIGTEGKRLEGLGLWFAIMITAILIDVLHKATIL